MAINYFSDDTNADLRRKITSLIAVWGDLRSVLNRLDRLRQKMATNSRMQLITVDQTFELEQLSSNHILTPSSWKKTSRDLGGSCEPFLLRAWPTSTFAPPYAQLQIAKIHH